MSRPAVRHLKRVDPTLRRVIERVGPCRLTLRTEGVDFDHLARAIVYQQLAGKAAAAIHGRLLGLYGDRPPTPAELLGTRAARLRRAGLSRQKLAYLKDLARHVHTGALPLGDLADLSDEAIIEAVTQVKGIGVWTAQMFLMFRLGRPDVLPVLDFGIRNAVRLAYGLRKMPKAAQLERIAAPWRPYRTVACWYLWRSLDVRTP
jgi:DNA-3-methyladenine glycosylase II